MWNIMNNITALKGKELTIAELDDIINEYYEERFEPKGFTSRVYRVYQYNQYILLVKCKLLEKSSIIRENKVRIEEFKAVK